MEICILYFLCKSHKWILSYIVLNVIVGSLVFCVERLKEMLIN